MISDTIKNGIILLKKKHPKFPFLSFRFFSFFVCRKWSKETISHILKLANSQEASKAGTFVVSGHSIFKEKPEVRPYSHRDRAMPPALPLGKWMYVTHLQAASLAATLAESPGVDGAVEINAFLSKYSLLAATLSLGVNTVDP